MQPYPDYVLSVSPHLEYAAPEWNPYLIRDINSLESVQKFAIKVTGTRVCHVITVTRFMQPTLILTLSSLKLVLLGLNLFRPAHMYMNANFLQRHVYMARWPLPHKLLNSASIPQTFSIMCKIALSASRRSYKT